MQTIKRIGFEDYGKTGIVYSEEFIKERGIKIGDKIDDDDDFIIDSSEKEFEYVDNMHGEAIGESK